MDNKAIKYYNDNQDEWEVIYFNTSDSGAIMIRSKIKNCGSNIIGFYEWIFNPIYKVFEVFKPDLQFLINMIIGEGYIDELLGVEKPRRILSYLSEVSK